MYNLEAGAQGKLNVIPRPAFARGRFLYCPAPTPSGSGAGRLFLPPFAPAIDPSRPFREDSDPVGKGWVCAVRNLTIPSPSKLFRGGAIFNRFLQEFEDWRMGFSNCTPEEARRQTSLMLPVPSTNPLSAGTRARWLGRAHQFLLFLGLLYGLPSPWRLLR